MALTPVDFARIARSLPDAEQGSHMGHPDFRVAGKIFATLGYPDNRFGTLMLTPQDQAILVRAYPDAFAPAAGAWGRAGGTSVLLRRAPKRAVKQALEAAWERRAPVKARERLASKTKARAKRRP